MGPGASQYHHSSLKDLSRIPSAGQAGFVSLKQEEHCAQIIDIK